MAIDYDKLKALKIALFGVKTEGPMAPEISLASQRSAEYVFSRNVAEKLDEIRKTTPNPKKISTAA